MKVLVTGAGALLGQGIIRALRGSTLPTHIAACDPSPLAAGLYWADSAYLIPFATAADYGNRVRALLARVRPDAVLLGTDVELHFFARHRAELEKEFNTKIIVSSPEVVQIADDKWLTYLFLRDNGFSHPDSALPDDVSPLVARKGYPLVVKPRHGARSVGVSVVQNSAELSYALARGKDLVVQECVGGPEDEHTSGLICFEGRCLACITMRRDLRDGNTYRAFPLPSFPLDAELRRIAEKLAPYGPVNFQFRFVEGQAKIFEINGRFSGTTPLRGLVGFPEVELVLRHVLRGDPVTQPRLSNQVILRHWSETVVPAEQLLQNEKTE